MFPGGLSPATFVGHAANYGVELTKEKSAQLKELWLNTFPEMRSHLSPLEDLETSNTNARRFIRKHLKKFKQPDKVAKMTTLSQLLEYLETVEGWPRSDLFAVRRECQMYMAQLVTGNIKRNCTYCAACNIKFQGLAAVGAKCALYLLWKEGFKLVNFIHNCFCGCKTRRIAGKPLEPCLPQRDWKR